MILLHNKVQKFQYPVVSPFFTENPFLKSENSSPKFSTLNLENKKSRNQYSQGTDFLNYEDPEVDEKCPPMASTVRGSGLSAWRYRPPSPVASPPAGSSPFPTSLSRPVFHPFSASQSLPHLNPL